MAEPEERKPWAIGAHPKVIDLIDEEASAAHARFTKRVLQYRLHTQPITLEYLAELYVIHARHHISLLSTPDQVRDVYSPYLDDLKTKISTLGQHMTETWTAPFDKHRLMRELQGVLAGCASECKADAFKFVRESATPIKDAMVHEDNTLGGDLSIERQRLLKAYKDECKACGVRVTDGMIAKSASSSWNDRTQVTWWKRNDPLSKPLADRLIRNVLAKKPHLPKS